jgi:hypothetical protein
VSLRRHTKGTYNERRELGLRLAKDICDAFVYLKGVSVTFLQGSIGIGDTQAKAPNDRRDGARVSTQSEAL